MFLEGAKEITRKDVFLGLFWAVDRFFVSVESHTSCFHDLGNRPVNQLNSRPTRLLIGDTHEETGGLARTYLASPKLRACRYKLNSSSSKIVSG